MGPKKDLKKGPQKRDQNSSIEEPLNTDSWKCVVMMAVERTQYDCFVLKEFMDEFSHGRRQEIGLIDCDTFLMEILKNFAAGQLPHKYLSLLNYSPILQEANEYVSKNTDIPAPVLAKVVKVLLFYLKDESLLRIEKKAAGPKDPILAMALRPSNFAPVDAKKKEPPTKKADNAPKVRPPSVTKEDTKLLKRGEGVKEEQRIDDAPLKGYFNLYVLLTRFYHPELPLELLKVGVPLHGLLCIDASHSGIKNEIITSPKRFHKRTVEGKSEDIQNFWDVFLKSLWDPKVSPYFKDTIFQVYVPRRLLCKKGELQKFIYREISYLLYDMSDFKRQLDNYLKHLKLWDVEDAECGMMIHVPQGSKNLRTECASVPLTLQCVIDTICGDDNNDSLSLSSDSIDSLKNESRSSAKSYSLSTQGRCGSQAVQYIWSQAAIRITDFDLLAVYHKTKELDVKYGLDSKSVGVRRSERTISEQEDSETMCSYQIRACGENMEEALAADGAFRSYWKRYGEHPGAPFVLDYCLYPLLMTRVLCPYLTTRQTPLTRSSRHSLKKNSTFQIIENLNSEMRKPHFTVTNSSRSILKALPYNMKDAAKDFFSPPEYKVVSPEQLKASSAPQFRIGPSRKIHRAIASEIFSQDLPENLFEDLRHFLGECFFANIDGFDFLELLGKKELLDRKKTYWNSYDCVDHTYSVVNDCIFIALHNRTEGENIHHETFNEVLRTEVGLRDFYEYVLEDEEEWLKSQEESLQLLSVGKNDSSQSQVLEFSESDMWVPNSIKYLEGLRFRKESVKAKIPSGQKAPLPSGDIANPSFLFEGYNVSDMAVQVSGLKTVYYSNDCSMRVELRERLYGNQELGIHITAHGHTLHLYSYVCPEPHITDPFTFHITYKNGVIVAFTRRLVEAFEEVEEIIESKAATRAKKNSSELSTRVVKRRVTKSALDEEFIYDMAASLPNGLSVRTVRRKVDPCYIVQRYLVRSDEVARPESSRLFLPNGDVVRMLNDGTVEVLKPDTSIVKTSLEDITTKDERLQLDSFRLVSGDGFAYSFQNGQMSSPTRLQILKNTDFSTNNIYFRRRDGTNYVLQSDGSLCTQFKDGTKTSISVFVGDPPSPPQCPPEEKLLGEDESETDTDGDFLFVYTKTTTENPDYATVSYDSRKKEWTVLLPQESIITIQPDGKYYVSMDNHTELRADESFIQVNSYSSEGELECAATADLSVFENGEGGVYCHMEDLKGKIFIVEANSNCYILDEEPMSGESESQEEPLSSEDQSQLSLSEFIASADLQCSPSVHTNCALLSRKNKYLVLKRDMTGYELLHSIDVNAALSSKGKGNLIFSDSLPGTDGRLFVLITPERIQTCKKWQVATVLPDPVYKPTGGVRETSSTYGCPPSWMHPFPKRKLKFNVPLPLSCRIFIETKRTELSPPVGEIECNFCELEEAEVHHSVPSEGVEEYFAKLSNHDQNLLTEMYTHVAESIINHKKKLKPVNSDKLDHYLCLSRYYLQLREYHKRCIRYHTVPNYFYHPAGISWLILNSIIDELPIPDEPQLPLQGSAPTEYPLGPEDNKSIGQNISQKKSTYGKSSTTTFSNEEIEYMSLSEAISFSELTYRSDLSAQTAPAVLRTAGLCTCKVRPTRDTVSAPVVKCCEDERIPSLDDLEQPHPRVCDFQEDDIEMLDKGDRHVHPLTLQDLMCLGLV